MPRQVQIVRPLRPQPLICEQFRPGTQQCPQHFPVVQRRPRSGTQWCRPAARLRVLLDILELRRRRDPLSLVVRPSVGI